MKRTRLTEAKIVRLLKEGEAGVSVDDLCRKYGISCSTYYKMRNKYGGMGVSDLRRLKQLEEENRRLKQMYADACIDNKILKDVVEKKLQHPLTDDI